ncbi:MAG: DEAD/DEAH box helicase [Candidatus Diapherotrites archaeon]|nr:DEAD/DEAH box helicase [Candidatus Diapherotrites archaeon]
MNQFVEHPLLKKEAIESRVYQEVLAARVLEQGNSLIVAPTALGKTVIAALVAAHMLAKKSGQKILILAPTKPLAAQHEKSMKKFFAIDEEKITLLTGSTEPNEREKMFNNSTIICATPQTIENDVVTGRINLGNVCLAVFDEAHKGVKEYSYVFIAQKYVSQAKDPLILALTASPSSEEEKIQDICRNLFIKNIEIRTDKDPDVLPFTNEIEIAWNRVDLPIEFLDIKRHLEIFMKEQLMFLKRLGYARSISSTYYGKKQLLELQQQIRRDVATRAKERPSVYAAASKLACLLKISHAHTLLETQGTRSLNTYMEALREQENTRPSKAIKFIFNDDGILLAERTAKILAEKGIDHPKVPRLKEILSKNFSEKPESRVLVFNHYRASIASLEKELSGVQGVQAKKFIGQATKGKDKGLTQKEQLNILQEFRDGKYNTLLCSSVAEEGLDIPSVDLVVFFEPVPSEIRLIQRRGRTGRFGKGKVIILMARATRDETFYYSSMAKERKMHSLLSRLKNESILEKQSTLDTFVEKKEHCLVYADHREQASTVTKELSSLGVFVKMKVLETGDYVITDDIVVERKTIEDFLESMIDGRLFNQLVTMSSNYASPLIIVEGNPEELFTLRDIHKNSIIGMLTSIAVNYRVPILFTRDARETAEYIYLIAKREQLSPDKAIRLRVGRKGLSMPLMQRFIVESLPTVGPVLAEKLLKKFRTIKKISNATEKELMEVEKLGEKKAKEIVKVLTKEYKDKEDSPKIDSAESYSSESGSEP